jgi:hypothetical protein
MLVYRCYLLDESDRIRSFIEVQASTDADAVVQARRLGRFVGTSFELWRGREMICRDFQG